MNNLAENPENPFLLGMPGISSNTQESDIRTWIPNICQMNQIFPFIGEKRENLVDKKMEDVSGVKTEEYIQLEEVPGPDPSDRRDHETVTVFNRDVVFELLVFASSCIND